MVIATTGAIYLSQFNTELGKLYDTPISLNQADLRQMLGITTDQSAIYMSSGRGLGVSASSQSWGGVYTSAGQFTFNVPWYNSMYVQVRGAGGGGGQNGNTFRRGLSGIAGGTSVFYSSTNIIGYGGGGGAGGARGEVAAAGLPGDATGGSTNLSGGGSRGGDGQPASGVGGVSGAAGGRGGRVEITFTRGGAGSPVPYGQITVVIGTAGQNGDPASGGAYDGTIGGMLVSWT